MNLRYRILKIQAQVLIVFGRNAAASAVLDRMLAEFGDDAYVLASRAHLHALAGRRDAAIADYRRTVACDPKAALGWFNLGFLLEESGERVEAEGCFRQAIALDPGLDRAWYGLGLVLVHAGRTEEAIAVFKRNTELQPMSPYGWYQLARVHVDRHEPDEAVRIIGHLKGFEPKVAAQLERETGLKAPVAAR